jgi:hypothetical protein
MKFFIPNTKPHDAEDAYKALADSLKSQFRLPILDHRIYRLDYTNSKRRWRAEVGKLEEQEDRYEILAIFESKSYIVFARSKTTNDGLTIMVDKSEVTAIEDFS